MSRNKTFEPAERQVYKHYLYLNGDEVLDSLAGLEGGHIEEVVDKAVKQGGGDAGLALAAGVASLKLGGHRKREMAQEVTRKRTAHSAIEEFLLRLDHGRGLARLSGPLSAETYERLVENDTLQIEADVQECVMSDDWDPEPQQPKRWERLLYGSPPAQPGGTALVITRPASGNGAIGSDADGDGSVLVPLRPRWMLEPPEHFERHATIVGQIRWVLRSDECCVWNGRFLELSQPTSGRPSDQTRRFDGEDLDVDDLFNDGPSVTAADSVDARREWRKPVIVITPLCIYK